MQKIHIERHIIKMKDDYLIYVQNENAHIGSVVIAMPYIKDNQVHVTLNTWNKLGHKDDQIASLYAKKLCQKTRQTVCCVCGIHIDHITQEEISSIMQWVKDDLENLDRE